MQTEILASGENIRAGDDVVNMSSGQCYHSGEKTRMGDIFNHSSQRRMVSLLTELDLISLGFYKDGAPTALKALR